MTSEIESLAKEALILDLFDGYLNAKPSAENLRRYVDGVEALSVEAVRLSVKQYGAGLVERENKDFAPSAEAFAANTRIWQSALARKAELEPEALVAYPIGELPPPGAVPLGPIEIDYGQGVIDMRSMSPEAKDEVMAVKGLPKEVAGLLPKLRRMQ